MLLGHNDGFVADKIMKVTIAFNSFGPGLIERMPRCEDELYRNSAYKDMHTIAAESDHLGFMIFQG